MSAPAPQFPSTRYQGSKSKLIPWLQSLLAPHRDRFYHALDAFGGTGVVSYLFKQWGKQVTYNDVLRCNALFGKALIENTHKKLSTTHLERLLTHDPERDYPALIQRQFQDIYFTDQENQWLDRTLTHIRELDDPYLYAMAFFALSQACLIKRPYNLFHRKNLYLRLADVPRSFGNKSSWDRDFDETFRAFAQEINQSVFDNGQACQALCQDVFTLEGDFDLVYLDPPYISQRGNKTDYRGFYHFLEGMTDYEAWESRIDAKSKHKRLRPMPSPWTNKHQITQAFKTLLAHFSDADLIVLSYRSDGIPAPQDITAMLKRHKPHVTLHNYGTYTYALSTNKSSQELVWVAHS